MGSSQTWDGLAIADGHPRGSSVVVRRPRSPSVDEAEYLVLHRAHEGAGYEGDWAWTPPAGARQPGEAVYRAVLRELAEEAGLVGYAPWAIDVAGPWAVFGLDVPPDVSVELVDPEHDRFEWCTAQQAMSRVLPEVVATSGIGRMRSIRLVDFRFEPMADGDLSDLVRWRGQPHVAEWFGAPLADVEAARRLYTNRIRGDSATRMWTAWLADRKVGYLQDYPVAAYDDYAVKMHDHEAIGFDYLIGEPELVGAGVGTAMLWSFMRDVMCRDYPDAPRFTASPDHRNARSLRALAKCGLTQGLWIDIPKAEGQPASTEIVCTLDRRHWFG